MKKTVLFILGFLFVMNIWAQESKVQKIEVNLKYLFGLGTIDFNDIDESISSMGLGIEVNPGYKILSTPNMDFGIVLDLSCWRVKLRLVKRDQLQDFLIKYTNGMCLL